MAGTRENTGISSMEEVLGSEDLLPKILLNLPMKDLARCKGVCQLWKSIISKPRFSVQLSPRPNRTMLIPYWALENTYIFPRHNGTTFIGATKVRPPYLFEHGEGKVIGTCDGLICVSSTKVGDVMVWNPVINQGRIIYFPKVKHGGFFTFGFGFDKVSEDYKVVKVTQSSVETTVQIWNLYCTSMTSTRSSSRDRSRAIEFPAARVLFLLTNVDPVTVHGSCHWVAVSLQSKKLELVRFDMERETFVEIPFSIDMPNVEVTDAERQMCSPEDGIDGKQFRLRTYDMHLCLLITTTSGVEVWCMEENLSWSRKFYVQAQKDYYKKMEEVLGFSANNELITKNDQGGILARNAHTLRLLFPMERHQQLIQVVTYAESLVPVELTDEIVGSSNQK